MDVARIGVAILAVSSLAACATITRGTQQKFVVDSDPQGAEVELIHGLRCTTPCKLKIHRKSKFTVKVTKPGYEPATVLVQGKVRGGGAAGGLLGNAFAGGAIGLGFDARTGAMLSLTPNPVLVSLKPLPQPEAAEVDPMQILAAQRAAAGTAAPASTSPVGTPQF